MSTGDIMRDLHQKARDGGTAKGALNVALEAVFGASHMLALLTPVLAPGDAAKKLLRDAVEAGFEAGRAARRKQDLEDIERGTNR